LVPHLDCPIPAKSPFLPAFCLSNCRASIHPPPIHSYPHQSGRNTCPDSPVRDRITTGFFAPTTGYINRPDQPKDNTMIRELIERLKTWAKQTAAALKERLNAAFRTIKPTPPAVTCARAIVVASDGNVLNAGKRYRLTSGHAPIFSLFTFFGDR